MSRDALFSLFLLALVGWAVWEARLWPSKPQLFPWVIGFPLIVLLLIQLGLSLRAGFAARAAATRGPTTAETARVAPAQQATVQGATLALERRRMVIMLGWLAAFGLAVWLLSFPIGGTLATLAYLKTTGRERWGISLAITAGTALFFWATANLLYIPYPRGLLFEFVPLPGT